MAINPMQRKARNSFLLGMLLMLVIAGAVVALLIVQLKNYRDKELEEQRASVNIAVLNQDVKSGQVITADMLDTQTVNRNYIPENAIGDAATLDNYNLQDKEGNMVTTRYNEDDDTFELYITIDNKEHRLEQEEETGNYFITRNNEKEYIELNSVPVVAKVDMSKNTILTRELVAKADNISSDDVRKQEYNMIVLPTQIETGDYIDIRLSLPSGQDYIVVSKKEVTIPDVAGVPSEDTIWVNLSEAEIIMLNNAIVEAYRIDGAKLYANIYTDPGMQTAAITTYTPSREVAELINDNPNIIDRAKSELSSRYNANQRNNVINQAIQNNAENGDENVSSAVEEEITTTKENRKDYLDGLSAGTTSSSSTTSTTNTAQ